MRAERRFLQEAGHQLRNPLTVCRGHLQLLGDDPEERRVTIALVMDELQRMTRIVDDMQLLAEVEHPDFLRPEWIDVQVFAPELVAEASAMGPRDWRLEQAPEGRFFADRQRLTEALMNLAHNAIQHTSPSDTIALGVALSDGETRLWVRDAGVGIPVGDQPRIFERFVRGTDAHRLYRGSGLGLAIVKAVAEAHGGKVQLQSRLGEGSKFTIVVPNEPSGGTGDVADTDR
jgi:two-component system, OmpR family, sensor kinase